MIDLCQGAEFFAEWPRTFALDARASAAGAGMSALLHAKLTSVRRSLGLSVVICDMPDVASFVGCASLADSSSLGCFASFAHFPLSFVGLGDEFLGTRQWLVAASAAAQPPCVLSLIPISSCSSISRLGLLSN